MDANIEFCTVDRSLFRILIVEDNSDDQYFAKRTISRILPGSKVMGVSSIGDAYTACRNVRYDLILLDLNLPDGYGPNSVQEVRKFLKNPAIIVLTGLASPLTTQQSIEKGANRLFTKAQLNSQEFEDAVLELSSARAAH
jgi:CheY-like chemotaxis protein